MKKLLLWLIAIAVGVAAWTRLRRNEEAAYEAAALEPAPLGELGGEVDPELLAILACPLDKAPVSREGNYIVCSQCGRRYPIRDGIPVMLVEEAILPEQPPAAEAEQPQTSEPTVETEPVAEPKPEQA